jgi:hypothetical protein
MRAIVLPTAAQAHDVVVHLDVGGGAHSPLGWRTCLLAWGGLAVASWGVVIAIGARFF